MNPDYQQFIAAILDDPHDLQARLVFADYLEEVGDPRAELIRVQLDQQGLMHHDPERKQLRTRELKLLKQHTKFGTLPAVARELSACGGFPDAMEITIQRFLKHQEEIFSQAPIRRVVFKGRSKKIELLAECPRLRNLAGLTLKNHDVDSAKFKSLLTSPFLCNLEELDISGDWITPEILLAVSSNPNFAKLRSLSVSVHNATVRNYKLNFLAEPCFRELEELRIDGIDVSRVHPITESSYLSNLRELSLHGGGLNRNAMLEIQASSSYPKLRSLRITEGYYGHDERQQGSPIPKHVELQDLVELEISGGFTSVILADIERVYQGIEILRLSGNKIDDAGVEILVQSDLFSRLRALYLTNNQVSPQGAERLGHAKPRSLKLHLDGNPINRAEAQQLREQFGKSFLSSSHYYYG